MPKSSCVVRRLSPIPVITHKRITPRRNLHNALAQNLHILITIPPIVPTHILLHIEQLHSLPTRRTRRRLNTHRSIIPEVPARHSDEWWRLHSLRNTGRTGNITAYDLGCLDVDPRCGRDIFVGGSISGAEDIGYAVVIDEEEVRFKVAVGDMGNNGDHFLDLHV